MVLLEAQFVNRIAQGSVRSRDRRKKPDRKTNRSWQLIFDVPAARGATRKQT
jgi:hypothetical protein